MGQAGFSQGLISQTEVISFTRDKYEGGIQNWAIAQDKNNRLYVANNEGLLVYNGTAWQLYPVPNKTILRSIAFGPGGRLYAGAQDELGYFAPDKVGRLGFTSLKHLLPAQDQRFTDVWQLVATDQEVFFRSNAKIFKLRGEKFTVYPAGSTWLSLHKHQGQILAHDKARGLRIYQNGQWQTFVPKETLPPDFFITDLIEYQKGISLLSTVSHGLYLLKGKDLQPYPLPAAEVNALQHFTALFVLNDGSFLAGTYFNGIYRISGQGSMIENISTKNGMPNNTVRCLFADTHNGVWAGLDNGLAFFTYNDALKHINPMVFNNGAGYDAKVLNQELYFALSTGLLWLSAQSATDLSAIAQAPKTIIDGLTWNLSVIDKQLLAGRDDGLFVIDKKQARPVAQYTGYWACRPMPQISPLRVIAGNYLGLHFFDMGNEKVADMGSLEKFKESSRYVETEGNCIWVSHPYRGVYRITLPDKSIRLFSKKDGLPSDLDNHVFKIKGKIVFATPQGIYEYAPASNTIIKSKAYAAIFKDQPIRYLKEDEQGNLWFVQEKMFGVVDFRAGKPTIHYIPELKNKILSGFENIFPYNHRNILIGGEPGFYHLNYEKYLKNLKPFAAYVTEVKTSGALDSVLFGGYRFSPPPDKKNILIPYKLNSLLFTYTASVYGQPSGLEYSYYLQSFDIDWSHWSNNTEKEYTNLPAGTYTFYVKARKSPSHESSVYQFSFIVLPPWYQAWWAYVLYFLMLSGFLFALLKYQALRQRKKQETKRLADLQKFEEEQKQLAYQHQLALAESEREITHLRNEKLDTEIKHKNAELANATMNLVQKKEFILKIKKELQELQKNTQIGEDSSELKKLLKVLSEEQKLDEEWNNFSRHFNSVHGDFLTILKKQFPTLNPHDLRLCAYLRMNLSSKEIAPLLGISLRGVEISRYRLRKKLALPTEINLIEYLLNIEGVKEPTDPPKDGTD
ncbi:MAG: transcriptional regulator [Microscillaceae bacterium]|nr:transcriptional regulator [Microscillaceae bacterium]